MSASVAAGVLGDSSFAGGGGTAVLGLVLHYLIASSMAMPLSAARPGSKDPLWVTLSIVIHGLLIGVPIALFARRAVRARS